jgi:hypothetical protein
VRALTLLGFGNSFAGGAVTGLLVVYGVRGLGVALHDPHLGWLYTAGAVGALVASLMLPALVRRWPVGTISLIGYLVNPALLGVVALAPTFAAGLLSYGAWNACATLIIINGIALRQIITPAQLLSRVNTTARMIAWGGTPFGAAVGGALAAALDARPTYAIMAGVLALCAILALRSPLTQPANLEITHETHTA